jgi:hypothetical protein
MIWGNAAAAWALVALAVPAIIHMLVRRRAKPTPFPTLRFIPETRLASIERRTLDDAALLALRMGALASAVAAVAAPFLATEARRNRWDAFTVRAEVASGAPARGDADRTFTADVLTDGIARATAWLDSARPGRRHLLVRSTFPIGSITASDVAHIPPHVGLTFERAGQLPATNSFDSPPVIAIGPAGSLLRVRRETRLSGARTNVRDLDAVAWDGVLLEIGAPVGRRAAADEILRAVIAERAPVPSTDRRARIELLESARRPAAAVDVRVAWIAGAIARIWRDAEQGGWSDGLWFGADSNMLLIRTDATIGNSALGQLIRSTLAALAPNFANPGKETLAISDAQLAGWSRPPGPATISPPDQRPRDGRWFWLLSLALLGVEAWFRKASAGSSGVDRKSPAEEARVA